MDTYEMKYKNALEWARQVMNGETGFIRREVEEVTQTDPQPLDPVYGKVETILKRREEQQ